MNVVSGGRLAEAEALIRAVTRMEVGWMQLDARMGCPGFLTWKAQAVEWLEEGRRDEW